jgi:hypothetical protein
MWATSNNHTSTVTLLLDNGADAGAKSTKGHTVFDFVPPDNHKIAEVFIQNPQRDSWSSCGSSMNRWSMKLEDEWCMINDSDNKMESLAVAEMRRRMLMESALNLDVDLETLGLDDQETQDEGETLEFVWENCLPHQMLVFSDEDIPHILNTVILNIHPTRSKQQKYIPANVIFLSARFAHHFSSQESLETLLDEVIDSIEAVVKVCIYDMV